MPVSRRIPALAFIVVLCGIGALAITLYGGRTQEVARVDIWQAMRECLGSGGSADKLRTLRKCVFDLPVDRRPLFRFGDTIPIQGGIAYISRSNSMWLEDANGRRLQTIDNGTVIIIIDGKIQSSDSLGAELSWQGMSCIVCMDNQVLLLMDGRRTTLGRIR